MIDERELPPDLHETIRELRLMRRRLGITARELAGMLDLGEASWCRIELGKTKWSDFRTFGKGAPRRWTGAEVIERAQALLARWKMEPPAAKKIGNGLARHPNKGGNRRGATRGKNSKDRQQAAVLPESSVAAH